MNLENVKPLGDRILVRLEDSTKKIGSIYIPETESERQKTRGEVIALGKDATDLTRGDKVVFKKYAGTHHEIDGVKYVWLRETDIDAKLI